MLCFLGIGLFWFVLDMLVGLPDTWKSFKCKPTEDTHKPNEKDGHDDTPVSLQNQQQVPTGISQLWLLNRQQAEVIVRLRGERNAFRDVAAELKTELHACQKAYAILQKHRDASRTSTDDIDVD